MLIAKNKDLALLNDRQRPVSAEERPMDGYFRRNLY